MKFGTHVENHNQGALNLVNSPFTILSNLYKREWEQLQLN